MSIRFCEDCGNILTPSEEEDTHRLRYDCQICKKSVTEKKNTQENNIVYRNEVKLGQTEVKLNNSIINDPTYARSTKRPCPKCGYRETICFQNPNINDPGMKLIYVCCNADYDNTGKPCGYKWFKEDDEDKKVN